MMNFVKALMVTGHGRDGYGIELTSLRDQIRFGFIRTKNNNMRTAIELQDTKMMQLTQGLLKYHVNR